MNCIPLGMMLPFMVLTVLALAVLGYCGMVRWIQQRPAWVYPETRLDAVYIVANSVYGGRRVDAVLAWVRACPHRPLTLLVAEDPVGGLCGNETGELVPPCDWQIERLHRGLGKKGLDTTKATELLDKGIRIKVVLGHYRGTDGEMRALAKYLRGHPSLRRVAIATCRSHARRAFKRARVHAGTERIAGVIPAVPDRVDLSLRRVLSENLKLVRDALGLTYAPLLHRK